MNQTRTLSLSESHSPLARMFRSMSTGENGTTRPASRPSWSPPGSSHLARLSMHSKSNLAAALNRQCPKKFGTFDKEYPSYHVEYGVRLLTHVERAWLAGVIDGEGSIYISKVKAKKSKRGYLFMPYLSVSNSNYELMPKCARLSAEAMLEEGKRRDQTGMICVNTRVQVLL